MPKNLIPDRKEPTIDSVYKPVDRVLTTEEGFQGILYGYGHVFADG